MKRVLVFIVVLLLLAVGALLWLAASANSIAEKFRPELERVASEALGSRVALGKLEASILSGARLTAAEFSIGATEEQTGLTLKNLSIAVKVLPMLSGSLVVSNLVLEKPEITLRKTERGVEIVGLPQKSRPPDTQGAPASSPAQNRSHQSGTSLPSGLSLALEQIRISDAKVTFDDTTQGASYFADNIHLDSSVSVTGTTVNIPSLTISAEVQGEMPLTLTGKGISFDSSSSKLTAPQLLLSFLGNEFNLSSEYLLSAQDGKFQATSPKGVALGSLMALRPLVPALKNLELVGAIIPEINGELRGSDYNLRGNIGVRAVGYTKETIRITNTEGSINLSATPSGQKISSSDLSLQFNNAPITLRFAAALNAQQAQLRSLDVTAFSGSVTATAQLEQAAPKRFNYDLTLSNINLEEALHALQPKSGLQLSGTLQQAKSTARGALDDNPLQSLEGNTNISIQNGTIKNVNFAGSVLRAVNSLPFLTGDLLSSVPAQERAAIESPDTVIRSLTGDFLMRGGGLETSNLLLKSDFFDLEAEGRVGFDSELDLDATMRFSPEFSRRMAERSKNVALLIDGEGRLIIPLSLKGKPPQILFYPNMEKLAETGAKQALQKNAGKLLEKALGKKGKNLGNLLGF